MKCYLCKAKAKIRQQKNRYICGRCLARLIEKRIRKYSRINKIFSKGDKLKVKGEVAKYLLKSIAKDMPLVIGKTGKEVTEWTLDDEIQDYLLHIFEGKPRNKEKKIKLLKPITDSEAKEFARIKKLKFQKKKKDPKIKKMLDEINKKYPDAKYTLLKNIEAIE